MVVVAKVIPLVHRKNRKFEKETGITTSLTDADIKKYLDEVLAEIRNLEKE